MSKRQNQPSLAFAALAFILFPFAAGAQQRMADGTRKSVSKDLSQGATFTFKIAPNLPEFTFKIIPKLWKPTQWGPGRVTVGDIEVYRGDSKELLQHLNGCGWSAVELRPADSDWFIDDDFNFDGYQDIYVLTGKGATGNESGCVWLYNPATGRFDYNQEFSGLPGYKLDDDSKTIFTFERNGAGIYEAKRYKVENNRLVLIWSVSQDRNDEEKQSHCVVQLRLETEMMTVREEEAGEGDDRTMLCDPNDYESNPPVFSAPSRKPQNPPKRYTANAGAISQVPQQVELNEQGLSFMKEGDYGKATARFLRAALLEPGKAEYANNTGFGLYKMEQYEDAVYWFKKAIEADPKRAVAYLNLGDAYVKMLLYNAEARQAYEEYLELAPNSKSAPDVKKKLEALPPAR